MRIAIIGAGVSGLALAWLLNDSGHDIDVYEREGAPGGDCKTARFNFGSYQRWSDLGVNDFNAATYSRVVAVMDQLGVEYADL